MEFPRWFGVCGFWATTLAAVSFLLVCYLWMVGVDATIPEKLYQVASIILICWSVCIVLFPRVSLEARLHYISGLFIVGLIPVIVLGHNTIRVLMPRIVLQNPRWSFDLVPDLKPLFVSALLIVVLLIFTLPMLRKGFPTKKESARNAIWVCTFAVLALAPHLMFQHRAEALMNDWYRLLVNIRGEYKAPRQDIVAFEISSDQGISPERLRILLEILEKSDPRIIALVSNEFYGIADVGTAKAGKRILIQNQPSTYYVPDDPWSPFARNWLDWGSSFWSDADFSVYYRPRTSDVGVKVALQTTLVPDDGGGYSETDKYVLIGSSRIPVVSSQRAIINYYSLKRYGESAFRWINYNESVLSGSLETFVHSTITDRSMRVNFGKKQFEWRSGERGSIWNSVEFNELDNKIVLLSLTKQNSRSFLSDGFMYQNVIQNILDRDFLFEPNRATYVIISLILVFGLHWLFVRYSIFKALVILFVFEAIAIGTLFSIFMWFSVLVNPFLLLIPAIGSSVVFSPVLLMLDRKQLFQDRTRLESELRTAHDMQMGLMPKEDPVVAGFDISGICLPANEVGGDFFDYVWLDQKKTKLGIAVADVSGKAMKAAITAVMTSGMIYREVGENESPKTIMRKINKPMYAKLDSRMFTALSFAMIDTKKKELRFSNAGQAYPVLKRGKTVVPLEVKGARLPLGVKEDVVYGEMMVKLKKGDTVIFYTDGIPEAKNEKDEFYGFDRFKSLASGIEGASAKETRDRILEDVKLFTGKSPQYDDMTVVVVKVQG